MVTSQLVFLKQGVYMRFSQISEWPSGDEVNNG